MEKKCYSCVYFSVHPIYTNLGFCNVHKKLVGKDYYCESFKQINVEDLKAAIKERGWVYCSDCKRPIFNFEELDLHLRSNHHVTISFMHDVVAKEESPGAF